MCFSALSSPILFITALSKFEWNGKILGLSSKTEKPPSLEYLNSRFYNVPIYRYPTRSERFRVLSVYLPAGRAPTAEHWILRGVCLLCLTL